MNEMFAAILAHGGIATTAFFRGVFLRRSRAQQEALQKIWNDGARAEADRVVDILYALVGRARGGRGNEAAMQILIGELVQRGHLVNGWGDQGTFDARIDRVWGKPILITAFGTYKQITQGTVLYDLLQNYIVPELGIYAEQGSVIARPALKLIANPDCVSDSILSASLINQAKRPSIGVGGYILNASAWNVIGAYRADANLANDVLRGAPRLNIARGRDAQNNVIRLQGGGAPLPDIRMQSPQEVLQLTIGVNGPSQYNEVALQGTSAFNTRVRVSGFFVKVVRHGGTYYLLETMDEEMRDLAPHLVLYSQSVIAAMRDAIRRGRRLVAIVDTSNELHRSEHSLAALGNVDDMTILA